MSRELYSDEVFDLENFLDLVLNPEAYGCAFDKGDPATYQERAGNIIDAARDCIEALRGRRNGIAGK